ncbi:NAD(P)H-binding protein [Brevibacterium sp. GP-SGM9]|uniref:NAD(P)H-binding protein n=1 Tax=Brevibacterium sp. GP-SGM9 TaxID=3376990 RepID=UPI0039A5E896
MRVLVIGSTGYVASRLIPTLLKAGHQVIAGARRPAKLDRFYWSDSVERAEIDVLDETSITKALRPDIEAVIYLVHGMDGMNFRATDRKAARNLVSALPTSNVERLVYLSGIVPQVKREALSEHLISRLEVEEILAQATPTVITLRAAMLIGAGSASFDLMAELTRRLPITIVPYWMNHQVEPISVEDVTLAIEGALTARIPTGHYDVGCGQRLSYPDLLELFAEAASIHRDQLHLPFLPEPVVAKLAARITSVHTATAEALIESLQQNMVAADARWTSDLITRESNYQPCGIREAISRSLKDPDATVPPSSRDPLGHLPGDH